MISALAEYSSSAMGNPFVLRGSGLEDDEPAELR